MIHSNFALGLFSPMVRFSSEVEFAQVGQIRGDANRLKQQLDALEQANGVDPNQVGEESIRVQFFKQPGNKVRAQIQMPIDGVRSNIPYNPGDHPL